MRSWRAGCVATRTSGSEGGPGRRSGRKVVTAPRSDPTTCASARAGHVVSMAALVAVGVAANGERRILGLELSAGNDEGIGLAPVHPLVSSSAASTASAWSSATATPGSSRPSGEQLLGSAWQRCRVHLTRNAQDLVPRSRAEHGRERDPARVRAARRGRGPPPARRGHRHRRPALSRRSPSCSPTPSPTCSRTSRSPRPTAARSAAPTRSSGSTRRSSAGPGSSGSSPPGPRSSVSSG